MPIRRCVRGWRLGRPLSGTSSDHSPDTAGGRLAQPAVHDRVEAPLALTAHGWGTLEATEAVPTDVVVASSNSRRAQGTSGSRTAYVSEDYFRWPAASLPRKVTASQEVTP